MKVPNRFELVMIAGQRARDILSGSPLTLDRDNDKNPVVALREIADGTVDLDTLRNSVVQGLQKHVEVDEPEEEEIDILATRELVMEAGEAVAEEELDEDGLSVRGDGTELDGETDFPEEG